MDIITKTLKIQSTNKFVIPKQIIEKLGITHKDSLMMTVGETEDEIHRFELRFNFSDKRNVYQPPLPLFHFSSTAHVSIRKGTGTNGSYSVIVPSQILVHHDFSIGDKVRWSLWLDDDDIVREVLIEYLPVGSVC